MGLLRADLQSLRNAFCADARPALTSRLLPPLILFAMHWMLGSLLLQHPEMLRLLRRGGDPLGQLFAQALAPGPVVAGWIGFAQAQRQLFEAPELPLWESAPVWPGRPALQVLLRAIGNALLWTTALAAPLAGQLLWTTSAPWWAWVVLPLALALATVPGLCAVLITSIVLLRLASGRLARLGTSVLGSLAAFGFPIFLLAQVFVGGQHGGSQLAVAARGGDLDSPVTSTGAALLLHAQSGRLTVLELATAMWPLVAGILLVAAVARWHPIAVQNWRLAGRPTARRRSQWSARPLAVLRRKELTQLLQQPGAVLHMVLVGVLVHLFAAQGTMVRSLFEDTMPLPLQQCAAMLVLWFLAVLMLLYSHMGRLAAADGAQWPLFMQAPIAARVLLLAKLQVIALLLLWPLLVAGWAGVQWFAADAQALLLFFGFGVAGSLVALAVVALVGTWPWLVRTEIDGRLTQGSRGLVGSMALVFAFYFALSPAVAAWLWLQELFQPRLTTDPLPATVDWAVPLGLLAYGLAALLLGSALWVGARNYRRLLQPR